MVTQSITEHSCRQQLQPARNKAAHYFFGNNTAVMGHELRLAVCRLSLLPAAVFVTRVDPNYAQPWQKCPQRSATGSAFVLDVEKHIIVTNAHVVGACARHGTHQMLSRWAQLPSQQQLHRVLIWQLHSYMCGWESCCAASTAAVMTRMTLCPMFSVISAVDTWCPS